MISTATPATSKPTATVFRIRGLEAAQFQAIFALSDQQLAAQHVIRMIADQADAYPCRVSVDHAPLGDDLLLLNFEHQPARSPYRASGPIFVSKSALSAHSSTNAIPAPIAQRLISFRAYDESDLIIDAQIAEGTCTQAVIQQLFANANVRYLHLHYARRGCFACRVDRA